MSSKSIKVHVPQEDGEVVLTIEGNPDNVRRFVISDHIASPRNLDEQTQLLQLVDGSRVATAKDLPSTNPSTGKPGQAGATDNAAASSAANPKE
jgi:hypothetical protein